MSQRGEEAGGEAGEGCEHESSEAEHPGAGAGLRVDHMSLPWPTCPSDDAAHVCRGP